jgi:hypothetical protein
MRHYVDATYVSKQDIRLAFDSDLAITSNCTTVQLSREEAMELLGKLIQVIQRAYQK